MKRSVFILTFYMLAILSVKAQDQQPKIATDKNDPGISILTGTWYSIPQPNEMRPSKYSKLPQDTTNVIIYFEKDGKYTIKNKVNPTDENIKRQWILFDDKLYLESAGSEKGIYSVFNIQKLTETELEVKYSGFKNIYEPFSCGEGYLFSITEVPAQFGSSPQDLENYFTANLKLLDEGKFTDTGFHVEFIINCHGEVLEVEPLTQKGKEFSEAIVSLIKQMPKWSPATQRGEAVNIKKKLYFIYKNGLLIIKQ